MIDPNDNLKRLTVALGILFRNARAVAALRALVATDVPLTLFLFGQDYFGWWRCPWPSAVDGVLVAVMTSLSLTICGFLTLITILYFFAYRHATTRSEQPRSRVLRMILFPASYAWPAVWGHVYLTGGDARPWGSLAVAYEICYCVCVTYVMTAERFTQLRSKRTGTETAPVAREVNWVAFARALGRRVRLRIGTRLKNHWWRLTHPRFLRRMRPIDRALYGAVARDEPRGVEVYLTRGADPNLRVMFDLPLLAMAVGRDQTAVTRLLLEAGANPQTASTDGGLTPLFSAASRGDVTLVRLLLEHGIEVNACNHLGVTALSLAARQNRVDVVRLLLAHGAQVNTQSNSGATPLMVAASVGYTEAVRALLEAGADQSLTDKNGRSALDHARRKERADVIALLEAPAPANRGA